MVPGSVLHMMRPRWCYTGIFCWQLRCGQRYATASNIVLQAALVFDMRQSNIGLLLSCMEHSFELRAACGYRLDLYLDYTVLVVRLVRVESTATRDYDGLLIYIGIHVALLLSARIHLSIRCYRCTLFKYCIVYLYGIYTERYTSHVATWAPYAHVTPPPECGKILRFGP